MKRKVGKPPKLIEFNGQHKSVLEWSESTGLDTHLIHYRLRAGWPIKNVLTIIPFRHSPLVRIGSENTNERIDEAMDSWRNLMSSKYTKRYLSRFRMEDYKRCGRHYKEFLNQHDIAA